MNVTERAHACAARDVASREIEEEGEEEDDGSGGRETDGKRVEEAQHVPYERGPGCIDRETRCDVGVRQDSVSGYGGSAAVAGTEQPPCRWPPFQEETGWLVRWCLPI